MVISTTLDGNVCQDVLIVRDSMEGWRLHVLVCRHREIPTSCLTKILSVGWSMPKDRKGHTGFKEKLGGIRAVFGHWAKSSSFGGEEGPGHPSCVIAARLRSYQSSYFSSRVGKALEITTHDTAPLPSITSSLLFRSRSFFSTQSLVIFQLSEWDGGIGSWENGSGKWCVIETAVLDPFAIALKLLICARRLFAATLKAIH